MKEEWIQEQKERMK